MDMGVFRPLSFFLLSISSLPYLPVSALKRPFSTSQNTRRQESETLQRKIDTSEAEHPKGRAGIIQYQPPYRSTRIQHHPLARPSQKEQEEMSGYPYASVGGFVVPPVVSGLDDNYVPSRDRFRGYDDTICFDKPSDWYTSRGLWMGRLGHGPPAGARGWVYKGHFPGFDGGPPFDLYQAPEGDKDLGAAWEHEELMEYEREQERRRGHGGSRSHGSRRGHRSGHTHASTHHSSHQSSHRSGAPSTRYGSSHRSGLDGSHHGSANAFQSHFESHRPSERGSVHGSRYGLGSSHHGSRHDSNFGGHSSHHGHHSSHGRSEHSSHHGGGSREGTRYGLASSHHGHRSSHHGGAASRHGTSRSSALRTELSW